MRLAIDRLYAPSNRGEHPQHPVQLLLFASSLDIDRKAQSAYDRFIDSSNRGLHKFPAGSTQEVIPPYSRRRRRALLPTGTCRSLRDSLRFSALSARELWPENAQLWPERVGTGRNERERTALNRAKRSRLDAPRSVFKIGEAWQPHARSVRLRRRSVSQKPQSGQTQRRAKLRARRLRGQHGDARGYQS